MPPEPTLAALHAESIRAALEHGDLAPLPGRPVKPGRPAKRRHHGAGSLTKRGRPGGETWWASWYDATGRRVGRSLGPVRQPGSTVGRNRREAEAELRRLRGEDTAVRRPAERVTLAVLAERYLRDLEVRGRRRSTRQDVAIHLRHAGEFLGDRAVASISEDDVREWRDHLLATGRAPQTTRNHLASLSGAFAHACKRRWAAANPVAQVEAPSASERPHARLRYLEPEQVEALLRAASSDARRDLDRALWITAAMTGLRQGELVALRVRDLDFEQRTIRVSASRTRGAEGAPKSGRGRLVPLADRVARELAPLTLGASPDDLVFRDPLGNRPDRGYDPSMLRRRYKAALQRAGLPAVTFHGLRHSFGVASARAGVPIPTLQAWLGHAEIATTMIYAAYAPGSAESAAWIDRAFAPDTNPDTNLSAPQRT